MTRNYSFFFCIAGTLATGCALPGITADYDNSVGGGTNGGAAHTGGSGHSAGTTNLAGNSNVGGKTNTGGASNVGGATSAGGTGQQGGTKGGGGATTVGGSTSNGGAAGAVTTGGALTVGGVTGTGGTTGMGGQPNTGGSKSTGGTANIAGTSSVAGSPGTGGTANTGGSKTAGGATSTGGSKSTGGTTSTGGVPSTGGSKATGGTPSTGGVPSTGGTPSTGGATSLGKPIPVQMSAGDTHVCAIVSDGTVNNMWCWGSNTDGQLADGTAAGYSTVPVKVTMAASSGVVKQVSAGYNHSCAKFSDGTAQCWGYNGDGQLGNGKIDSVATLPVTVMANATTPLTNIQAIYAGKFFTCAVVADTSNVQTVKCWGWSGYGQLGTGIVDASYDNPVPNTVITNTSTKPPLTNVRSISVGYQHSCAVLNDNTVYCWGENSSGQLGNGVTNDSGLPVAVTNTAGSKLLASSLATLAYATCALLADGTVQCWGTNSHGELGNGGTEDSLTPVAAKLTAKATSISGYFHNACVVVASTGGAQCWGDNSYGELAQNPATYPACNGSSSCSNVPINVTFPNSVMLSQVVAGSGSTYILASDGSIYDVGYNADGELGNGNTTRTFTPVSVYVSW